MASAGSSAGVRGSGGRVPWGTISREQIVDAAARFIRAGGYERLTIRRLAAELGVSPMALYHHVRDKDDLLDEVVDRFLARVWRPRIDPDDDWRAWIGDAAEKLRKLLVSQPAALHVYLAHPVVSRAATTRMDSMMSVLRQALGEEETAERAYAAIHTYTVGFAALEASRSRWRPLDATLGSADETSRGPQREGRPRSRSEDPHLVSRLAAYTTADQFRQGLNYLLDGIGKGVEPDEVRNGAVDS